MESNARRPHIQTRDCIDVLLAEYEALYALVAFRMTSLDRRAPVTGAAFSATIGGVALLPPPAQIIFLCGLPIALVWFLRTTANHARSFEDALRQIDAVERRVNELAGVNLLTFQSCHPSRGRTVGGRTGVETMRSAFVTSIVLLAGCVYYAHALEIPGFIAGRYDEYAGIAFIVLTVCFLQHLRYRYEQQPPSISSV